MESDSYFTLFYLTITYPTEDRGENVKACQMSRDLVDDVINSSTTLSATLFDIKGVDSIKEESEMDVQESVSIPSIGTGGPISDTSSNSIDTNMNGDTSVATVPVHIPKVTSSVPPGPPVLPSPSPMLLLSRKADDYFKRQAIIESFGGGGAGLGGYKTGCSELPCVPADGKLLWIICILRDPQVQDLLLKFLSSRLSDMLKPKSSVVLPRFGMQSSLPCMERKIVLPNEDLISKFTIQLCQLSLTNEYELCGLDQSLVRVEIPMIMFDVLCSSSSSDLMMTDALTTDSISCLGDEETLENYVAQSSHYKLSQDIAKHAIEVGSKCCVLDSQDQPGDPSLRFNLFENIAKQLLELNTVSTK